MTLRVTFTRMCRETRIRLGITQQAVADALGVSRGYIANIEAGRANPTLDQVDRIAAVLGIGLAFDVRPPIFVSERRPHDLVHAACSAYVARHLRRAGMAGGARGRGP